MQTGGRCGKIEKQGPLFDKELSTGAIQPATKVVRKSSTKKKKIVRKLVMCSLQSTTELTQHSV